MARTPKLPSSNFTPTAGALPPPPVESIGIEPGEDRTQPFSDEPFKTDIGEVGHGLVSRRFKGKLGS